MTSEQTKDEIAREIKNGYTSGQINDGSTVTAWELKTSEWEA